MPLPDDSPVVRVARRAKRELLDLVEAPTRGTLVPPRRLRVQVGNESEFFEEGKKTVRFLVSLLKLKPEENILDVGCGCGRVAVPLTKYINEKGAYFGFDINEKCIRWCTQNISPKFPNFNFKLADIYNKNYNVRGKGKGSEYKFPYADDFFDVAFLSSVFTHMLPPDVENYLSEISRVLRPSGRCLITYFIINEESQRLNALQPSQKRFKDLKQGHFAQNELNPEAAIAYREETIKTLHEKYKLPIKKIYYGNWCGREKFTAYQDMVVSHKNVIKC